MNNAGATKCGGFFKLTDADWEDGFALKFYGAVRLTVRRGLTSKRGAAPC